ncbi:MAG TPA: tetratricopeptide repeat protein, partial [Longimicrobiales bacterium]|nr:tetratricopeptide repeat protein [Longimicrobiales bacterium]
GPAAAGAFFLVTLVPVLGFLNVYPMRYSYVADHFQYLATLGPITLAVGLLTAGGRRLVAGGRPGTRTLRLAGGAAAGALLAVLGLLTLAQSRMYRNEETLWRATLVRNPRSWMAHNNLGMLLAARGETDRAIGQFQEALRERPDHAGALSNLGGAYLRQGKLDQAKSAVLQALALDPDLPGARNSLAQVLLAEGRAAEALRALEALVRDAPAYAPGEGSLGSALLRTGRAGEAEPHLRRALELDPHLADARFNLALLLGGESRHRETIEVLREGLRMEPANASFQQLLAWELATTPDAALRDGAEAVRLARAALAKATATGSEAPAGSAQAASPADPVYAYTLAAALAEAGEFPAAIAAAQRAESDAARLGRTEQAATIHRAIEWLRQGRALH